MNVRCKTINYYTFVTYNNIISNNTTVVDIYLTSVDIIIADHYDLR